jgi:hypothetical protein
MENVLDPCQNGPEALVWWLEPLVGGEGGGKCTLGPVRLEIDVEAEDAGHKVAGLADDPRIL